jgi:hypothetical protein
MVVTGIRDGRWDKEFKPTVFYPFFIGNQKNFSRTCGLGEITTLKWPAGTLKCPTFATL